MPHIFINNNLPGISGLLKQFPETAKPLCELAETLLRKESSLTRGERELIATYVSLKNDCYFCFSSHSAAAAAYFCNDYSLIDEMKKGIENISVSEKMKSLLLIAGKVQEGGKQVNDEIISSAKNNGATDEEIHLTVLIASAFCMFNRYVDGLQTFAPQGRENYTEMGKVLAQQGYIRER